MRLKERKENARMNPGKIDSILKIPSCSKRTSIKRRICKFDFPKKMTVTSFYNQAEPADLFMASIILKNNGQFRNILQATSTFRESN